MITRSFYFIRHGQTDWNAENRLQGQTDIPLNIIGKGQALEAEEIIAQLPVEMMYASPLSRASETAAIINNNRNLPVMYDAGLMERNFGLFEGKTTEEIHVFVKEKGLSPVGLPVEPTGYPAPPEGEDFDTLFKRSTDAINRVLKDCGKETLIVSHGGVFSALAYVMTGDGVYRHSDNCVPYHFIKISDDKWLIKNLKTGTILGEQ